MRRNGRRRKGEPLCCRKKTQADSEIIADPIQSPEMFGDFFSSFWAEARKKIGKLGYAIKRRT
jgi:hypothetical protein